MDPAVTEAVQKKPRSEAQMAALDAARRKALQIRAERAAQRKQEQPSVTQEVQKPPEATEVTEEPPTVAAPEEGEVSEVEEEIEYIKKSRASKKQKPKKRIVVVEEESSEEEELEIRLPPRRKEKPVPETPRDPRFDQAYSKMFSL